MARCLCAAAEEMKNVFVNIVNTFTALSKTDMKRGFGIMENIVETTLLTKNYGSTSVVDGVSLQVPEKCVYGFLGRNGAGKTTTMKMLLGLTKPTGGSISVFGKPFNRKEVLPKIGSLIEQPSYYGHLTGESNLEIVRRLKGADKSQVAEVLSTVGLTEAKGKLAKSYSLGMKQRLGLAMALLGDPKLLILDEPTNGLDPAGIHEMRELICSLPEKTGTTVMISSHILSEIEAMADVVGIINQGKIVYQGTLTDLESGGVTVLKTSNQNRAAEVISSRFNLSVESNAEGKLLFGPVNEKLAMQIVQQLVIVEQIGVIEIWQRRDTLESTFLKLTTDGIK